MDSAVLVVFVLVYLGMLLGRLPGTAVDRTGVALLGAIVLLAFGRVSLAEAWRAIDVATISLLLGLMVVSAQFRQAGFYERLTRRLAARDLRPGALLAALIGVTGLLSALLANDIVCLAMAPVLVEGCARRGLDPVPYLLGLACAANVGSAATLIGNPQNMLIGQVLGLSFSGYLLDAIVPAALGLGIVWLAIVWLYRGRWERPLTVPAIPETGWNRWQVTKGILVLAGLILAFLFTPWPRGVVALGAAGILLASRRLASRDTLGLVDWQLLVLFAGLFVVNHALLASGMPARLLARTAAAGVDLAHPGWLFVATVVLSNLVSNVPATMLLLPAATHAQSGPVLALASTLAGNLFVVGSIANIIVIDQAVRLGVRIGWREHARVGVPVTLATLAIAATWLRLRAF
jgi:Na+/H+ antiporter NhaD/arsenite permease-like protein